MASKKSKSGKRLNTSSLGESLKGHTFFVDRSSGKAISEVFKELGLAFELLDDHFPQNTEDVVWIEYCGANSRVIITSDREIRHNDIELIALMAAKVASFFFTRTDWKTEEKQAAIRTALPKMANMILNERRSFIGRISKDGTVERWYNHKGNNLLSGNNSKKKR